LLRAKKEIREEERERESEKERRVVFVEKERPFR